MELQEIYIAVHIVDLSPFNTLTALAVFDFSFNISTDRKINSNALVYSAGGFEI